MPATWVDPPRDYTAGELITATIGNQEWRDRMMYLKASPAFTGSPTIAGTLAVTGAISGAGISGTTGTFSGNASVAGSLTVGTTLGVTGATTLTTLAATTISGTTGTFSSAASVATSLSVGTTLGVTGATTMTTLAATAISGTTGTFSSNASVAGSLTVGTTLGVTGATTLSSTLGVTGAITAASLASSGTVSGAAGTFSGLLTVQGFGTNTFESSGAGISIVSVRNTSANAAAGAQLSLGNDLDAGRAKLTVYSSTYAASGAVQPDGLRITHEGTGGISVEALADLRLYSRGGLAATFGASQAVTFAGTITGGVWNAGAVTSSGAITGSLVPSTASGTGPRLTHQSARLYLLGGTSGYYFVNQGDTAILSSLTNGGAWQWNTYGAGTLTTDASGNVTAVSDERLKDRITDLGYGLAEILALRPVRHGYNQASGLDREHLYGGFLAQNVQQVMPLAVGQDIRGFLTLSDRPITGALVVAVQELAERITQLEKKKL